MYPKAYLDYLIYFHVERDYFECHEVLEDHWKEYPRGNRQAHWVALIQLAVGLYHHRRNNKKGAEILYQRAAKLIAHERAPLAALDLDVPVLLKQVNEQLLSLQKNDPFTDIDLPIKNPALLAACEKRCRELLKVDWKYKHEAVSDSILHKHRNRDLQAVIAERERQLALRQAIRGRKERAVAFTY